MFVKFLTSKCWFFLAVIRDGNRNRNQKKNRTEPQNVQLRARNSKILYQTERENYELFSGDEFSITEYSFNTYPRL